MSLTFIVEPESSGELIDNDQINEAKQVDNQIRSCIRDFAQLGELLMKMRDNQLYKLVGPYNTFEEYCKDVEGLSIRMAMKKVQSAIVYRAIAENSGGTIVPPETENQVRALYEHENALAKFKYEKRVVKDSNGHDNTVKVPVAVSNAKEVAKHWEQIVKKYESEVEKAETAHARKVEDAERDGAKPPPFRKPRLSGNYVANSLPACFQPLRTVTDNAHPFVKWVSAISKQVEKIAAVQGQGDAAQARWERLVQLPERKKLNRMTLPAMLDEIDEALDAIRMFKEDLKSEFRDILG